MLWTDGEFLISDKAYEDLDYLATLLALPEHDETTRTRLLTHENRYRMGMGTFNHRRFHTALLCGVSATSPAAMQSYLASGDQTVTFSLKDILMPKGGHRRWKE